jgi:RimJ/RimL family protein N-acetyltransferase
VPRRTGSCRSRRLLAVMHETQLPRDFSGGRLRRLRPTDRRAFQAYRAIPELGRYQGWSPMSEAEALEFLAEMNQAPLFTPGEWMQLGIAEPESDSLIGDIGLYLSEDGGTGEVGFTLQPSAQGRGTAGRAVREALQLLFATTAVSRVLGITDARNLPSIRLLERSGFKYLHTRQVQFRGEPCSENVYALERNDG